MFDAAMERHWVSFEGGGIWVLLVLVARRVAVGGSGRRLRARFAVVRNACCVCDTS